MTDEQICATKEDENEGNKSERYQFRVPLLLAIEVEEERKNAGNQSVTQFFLNLLKDRQVLRKHRRELAESVVAQIQRYSLTPRDLSESGLAWSDWTSAKQREGVEKK